MEADVDPVLAVLCSVLSLSVSPPLGRQMLELQSVLLNRARTRELMKRERTRRKYLRRRRAFLLSSITAILSLVTTTQRPVWVRDRSQNFWGMTEHFDDEEWKAQFRLSRPTFDYVLKLIGLRIKRRRKNYLVPIEPSCRLAMTLWWFARSEEYRSIASLFGVGIATVCTIVRQVISAIVDRLYRRFVSLPSGQRLDDTIRAFEDRCYPQCAGAIGGTHIPIAAPRDNPEHYMNKRGWYSVILQAVVDHELCFTDVYPGWPGGSSSAAVLSSSDLFLKAEDSPDGYLFPRETLLSDGVEIPVHLIGNTSLPLKSWLMKGYCETHQLSPEQRRYTFTLASAHSVVDTAFMRLKGRWRCLLKKSEMNVSMIPRVVAACCILHNICERRGDAFLPEWSVDMAPHGMYLIQPAAEPYEGDSNDMAEVIRDAIAYNLLTLLHN